MIWVYELYGLNDDKESCLKFCTIKNIIRYTEFSIIICYERKI